VDRSLIVGLANPGSRYDGTRHNVGAEVVAAVAPGQRFKRARLGIRAEVAEVQIGEAKVVLAVPRTFMNDSGDAVEPLARYFGADGDHLLIIHDDIDLPFSKLRIQQAGGDAGHNGVRSIVRSLSTDGFWRLKVGVGRPPPRVDPADYVLNRFSKSERDGVDDVVIRAAQVAEVFATLGGEAARERAGELN
jgi:PTH1 family peptidyl-tRNA hydrolase